MKLLPWFLTAFTVVVTVVLFLYGRQGRAKIQEKFDHWWNTNEQSVANKEHVAAEFASEYQDRRPRIEQEMASLHAEMGHLEMRDPAAEHRIELAPTPAPEPRRIDGPTVRAADLAPLPVSQFVPYAEAVRLLTDPLLDADLTRASQPDAATVRTLDSLCRQRVRANELDAPTAVQALKLIELASELTPHKSSAIRDYRQAGSEAQRSLIQTRYRREVAMRQDQILNLQDAIQAADAANLRAIQADPAWAPYAADREYQHLAQRLAELTRAQQQTR